MARGQASLEAVMLLCAMLALVGLLASGLAAQGAGAVQKADEFEAISRAEAAAMAVEAMFNAGGSLSFDFREEGVYYAIENGKLHADCGGKAIEVDGVFRDGAAEPV